MPGKMMRKPAGPAKKMPKIQAKPRKKPSQPRRRGKVIQMPGGYSARELKRRGR